AAVDDVLANSAVEQEHVLAHQSDGASQILELQLLNRPAVERDAPLFDLVESEQKLHQSALTRSGGADDSHGPSGGDVHRNVPQNRSTGGVGESNVADLNLPTDTGYGERAGARVDLEGCIEQIHDPVRRGHCALILIERLA